MKKRLLSLLLVLMLCISMLPVGRASAATGNELQSFNAGQNFSDWAFMDLVTGDTYGLYPLSWYEGDMTRAITTADMKWLLAGFRCKLLEMDGIQKAGYVSFKMPEKKTVEEVIGYLYDTARDFTFAKELPWGDTNAVSYAQENGIYTGKNGELGLKDICSYEQACVLAARLVADIYDKLDASSKGFLWETKANGNTVYMLGSIHMADTKIYPFSGKIWDAYQSADVLGVELNAFDTTGAMDLINMAVYTDGTTLKDHVSKETYDKVVEFAQIFGVGEEQISLMKPWYIYISFSSLAVTGTGSVEEASQGASLGIDMTFMTNALLTGKPIMELEGYKGQAGMLDSFSDELEEYLLNDTIDSVLEVMEGTNKTSAAQGLNLMLDLWRKGDAESFKQFTTFEYETQDVVDDKMTDTERKLIQEYYDKLFTERNKTMAEYIEELLKADGNKTYFVIVGSGHYLSDDSILDILDSKGYTITQIK